MKCFVNNIFSIFNIEKNQLNITIVKSIIAAMISKNICYKDKQKLVFDDFVFLECWNSYCLCLNHFDPNYNRKTDFSLFFKYLLDSILYRKEIEFHALFCPGYTKYGYKDHLGSTTTWKLEELHNIKSTLQEKNIPLSMTCYYSDVFLENCNSKLEPNWKEQLDYNRQLFHIEGEKYFDSDSVKNASDISIFKLEKDGEGYVDDNIISSLPKTTYEAFKKSNEKFYNSMGFNKEQIKFRNDRLITMYRLLSNYLNLCQNAIFLPMENMYERENIFSENGTCTMYLKLKR